MAHFVNSVARATLEAKTMDELRILQAQVEIAGRKAKEAMNTTEGKRAVTQVLDKGRWVSVTAAEATYNSCRGYWKDIETIIRERA